MGSRILLLSAPFGSGHLQAAKAIAAACRDLGAVAEAIDVENPVLSLVSAGYLQLLDKIPSAYRRLYNARVGGVARNLVHSVVSPTVRSEAFSMQPDAIVASHPFPGSAAAALRRRGRLDAPVAVVVTDFIPHAFWVHEGIDRYFVACPESAHRLEQLGVDSGRISVSGIPIRSGFGMVRQVRPDRDRRVLVMGGGLGLGPIVEAVKSLTGRPEQNLRITVVCGSNHSLQTELTERFGGDGRIEILGYTDQVPELMVTSDLLVSKPGGITCSESLACELPMLLLSPLPGHEEENSDHLVKTGAALVVDEVQVGSIAAELLFGLSARIERMRAAALQAGRPGAAARIAAEICGISGHRRTCHSLTFL